MKAEKSWHIDSGCSKHMAGNASKIIHISPKDSEICDLWTQQTKPTWSTSPISGIKWYQNVTCLWLITFDDCFLLSLMIFLWLFFIDDDVVNPCDISEFGAISQVKESICQWFFFLFTSLSHHSMFLCWWLLRWTKKENDL